MKAKLDRIINGKKIVIGNRYTLEGRIKGATRSRKMTKIWGNLGLQDVLRRVQYSTTAINTKYGTLGLKIISSIGRFKIDSKPRKLISSISLR